MSAAFGSSAVGRAVATASLTPLRRTPLRIRRSRIGASSRGSQPITSTVCANSMSGTDGLQRRRREPAGARRPARAGVARSAGVDVGAVEPLAHQALEQEALLVGRLAADQSADAPLCRASPAAASSARSHDTSRSSPPSRTSGWVIRSSTWIAW